MYPRVHFWENLPIFDFWTEYQLSIWAFFFFATRASQEVSQISLFDLNKYKIKFLTKLTGSMKYIWVNLCGLICFRQVVN